MSTRVKLSSLIFAIGLCLTPSLHADPITIMPLGDSITWGYNGSETNPATPGGYRDALYNDLTSIGYSVEYVGANTQNSSPTLTLAGQTAHNGYNGFTIDQISNNLDGYDVGPSPSDPYSANQGGYWLTGGNGTGRGPETAQYILLHIGTNDLESNYDPLYTANPNNASAESNQLFVDHVTLRLQALIAKLQLLEPNSTILVAGIIPNYLHDNGGRTALFDADVQNLIATTFAGTNVHYVDMFTPLGGSYENLAYYYPIGGSMYDSVHPNSDGYAEIGQLWANAIETYDVPEPSTLWLLGLGGMFLLWRVRVVRNKRKDVLF